MAFTSQPAASTGFTLGAQNQPTFPGFGAATTTTATAPGLSFNFGSAAPAATRPTAFATPFAAPAATTTTSGFTFGGLGTATAQTSTAQPSLGLFGGGTGFGTGGIPGASTFGGGLFGQAQPAATSTGLFGGFGAPSLTQQQPQQQQPQTQQQLFQHQLKAALINPQIFNDERDSLMAKWNQVQAAFGHGKAYFSSSSPALELTTTNPYCRFKTVAYNRLPNADNSAGLVTLMFDKKHTEILSNQNELVEKLCQLLGTRPNIVFQVHLATIKPVSETRTEVVLYVTERIQNTGESRKIPATDLAQYLNQSTSKAQITSFGVRSVFARVTLSREQLQRYLNLPPPGIDMLLWEQAKKNNPDSEKLLPVPIIGFQQLQERANAQQQENQAQQKELQRLEGKVKVLNKNHTDIESRVSEYKKQLGTLSHRLLKLFSKLQYYRRRGEASTEVDGHMLARLQNLSGHLNLNPNLRGRVHELLNEVKQKSEMEGGGHAAASYTIDTDTQEGVAKHLNDQQGMIKEVADIINRDLQDMQTLQTALEAAS